MDMKRSLRSWLWRVDVTQEVDEELTFHIEMRTRELVEGGWTRGLPVRWCWLDWETSVGSSVHVWTLAESEIERCD
jgi:hypothetical protein